MSLQGQAGMGALYSPENMEKIRADQKAAANREAKARCIELACRTLGNTDSPDGHVAAAEKYFNFINA